MTIRAYAATSKGGALAPFAFEPEALRPHEVRLKVSHCGICHSDLHLLDDDWGMTAWPFVPGHEVVGTVTERGAEVRHLALGQRVGVGWQAGSCHACEWCHAGEENLCGRSSGTCVQRYGGYAEALTVDARFAVPIPEGLPSGAAAPLLCGGVTVYSPLRQFGIRAHHRVGIVGIGGLGHLALQFARALGADVTAFTSTAAKEAEARSHGAHRVVITSTPGALAAEAGTLDFVLVTASADVDWLGYLGALRPKGALCVVGAAPKPLEIPAFALIGGQKQVAGSVIGSPAVILEMLGVAARHGIRAQVEGFPMARVNEAIAKVREGRVRYRAVLEADFPPAGA